jgi:DNA-binding MarR family transcriptional regulator
LDRTTVSRNLKLLERKGWIRSTRGGDRRERQITLTPAGRKRLAAGRPEWMKAQSQLRAVMTAEEWRAMLRMLHRVLEAVRAAHRELAAQPVKPESRRGI